MKKWLSLPMSIAAAAALTTSGMASATSFGQNTFPPGTLVVPMNNTGTYMDWTKTVYNRISGMSLVEEPVTQINAKGQVFGAAAGSWSVSPDKLTWTFHLRHLEWSNGTPVTAQDYLYAFRRMASPSTGYDFGWFWGTIADLKNWNAVTSGKMPPAALGVSAPNAYTLQVTSTQPVPFMPMAMIYAFPDPISTVQKYGAAWATSASTMVASGPYKIKTWVPHQYIQFVPNPDYKGIRPNRLKNIVFELVPQTDFSGYLTHQVDWTMLDPGQVKAVETNLPPASFLVKMQQFEINMLGFNMKVKPLNNVLVRRAFMLAIDRSELVNDVLKGIATTDNSIVPKGFPGYDPSIQEPYNVAEARKLLAQAGYPGGKGFPTLTLQIRDEPGTLVTTQPGAEFIQAQLAQNLGIHINVKVLDMPTWIANVSAGKAQLFIRPYNYDYPDPSDWYSLLQSGGVMNWNNKQYDNLVQEANASFNAKVRASLYHKAAELINQDVGTVFLWTDVDDYLVNRNVRNFPTTPLTMATVGGYIPYMSVTQ